MLVYPCGNALTGSMNHQDSGSIVLNFLAGDVVDIVSVNQDLWQLNHLIAVGFIYCLICSIFRFVLICKSINYIIVFVFGYAFY